MASRALGALLCVVCVVVAVAHIWAGYVGGTPPSLAFALPVTVGLLVVVGLGFWLGWIMATTKEAPPPSPSPPEPQPEVEKKEEPEVGPEEKPEGKPEERPEEESG